MQGFKRFWMRNQQGAWLLASSIALGILVAPFAVAAGEGDNVRLGVRNPGGGSSTEVTKETQIIAETAINTYGTRQSNKGAAAARSTAAARSSARARRTRRSRRRACASTTSTTARRSSSRASRAPSSASSRPATRSPRRTRRRSRSSRTPPASRTASTPTSVDGKDADQIIAEARQSNPAGAAPSFAFARVSADGKTLDANRTQGVTPANLSHPATGVYCFFGIASQTKSANANIDTSPGEVAVNTTRGGAVRRDGHEQRLRPAGDDLQQRRSGGRPAVLRDDDRHGRLAARAPAPGTGWSSPGGRTGGPQ